MGIGTRGWPCLAWFVAVAIMGCASTRAEDLSPAQLSQVIGGRQPELQRCYEVALASNPSYTEVKMHAAIYIKPDGKVYRVEVDDGGLPGMPACIEQTIKAWKFPEAGDETRASLPIIFRPEATKGGSAAAAPGSADG